MSSECADNEGAEPEDVATSTDSHTVCIGDDMVAPNKRTVSPAFQFYPNDFLGDPRVQAMTATEVGVFWLLIMACWNDLSGLPFDMNRLAAIARLTPSQFKRVWQGVMQECFDVRSGRVFHRRVEKERKKQAAFSKQQKDKADKRWQSHGNAMAMPGDKSRHASGNALQSSSSSSSSSSTSSSKKRIKDSSEASSEPSVMVFSTVGEYQTWELLPSHVAKWQSDFPNVDVFGECRKAHAWVDANPSKRKTARGMPSFLVKWLSRTADRGGSSPLVSVGSLRTAGNVAALQRFAARGSEAS